jgi:UDP-GlcNAc3NAcA epimerase
MKWVTVVGARPQFIKAAAVGYALESANTGGAAIRSVLVHTGQHYDVEMSGAFFDELGLQPPDRNLNIGSGSHGAQTGRMLEGIEAVLQEERPDVVLVYGDTNSTLAGALAAAKLNIPIAHIEAGLRSHNRGMPEELNRVLTDHVSEWLFCPGETAVANLRQEGIEQGVRLVGDVMYELVMRFGGADRLPADWARFGLERHNFVLATIHRAENTDDEHRLQCIVDGLVEIAKAVPVIVPLHPRTRKRLDGIDRRLPERLWITPPVTYTQMIAAEASAALVVTDSGGVQKEAFWLGIPCVTARAETEWPETLSDGRNVLAGESQDIVDAARRQLERGRLGRPAVDRPNASAEIVRTLLDEAALIERHRFRRAVAPRPYSSP